MCLILVWFGLVSRAHGFRGYGVRSKVAGLKARCLKVAA